MAPPRDLREWIALLEREGELRRVSAEVDPDLEITEIVDRLQKGGGGPARFAARIGDNTTDVYTLTFRADEPVLVAITGEGSSDLDLFVEDETGNRICASDGAGDDEMCRWTPRRTGNFRIRVRNVGKAYDEYRLWGN